MRIFIICLFFFATLVPARGEVVYFVSLAWIKHDQLSKYDAFLQSVEPIWQRHNMQVLVRTRVVDILVGDGETQPPDEIAVIRADSMEDFRSYLADPDYQSIKRIRLDSVERMFVMEGSAEHEPKYKFLQSSPQFAVVLGGFSLAQDFALIDIDVTVRGVIKGELPATLSQTRSVALFALSFDDNPLSFLDVLEDGSIAFVTSSVE